MATRKTLSSARGPHRRRSILLRRRAWLGVLSLAAGGLAALGLGRGRTRRARRIIWIGHI